jgi:hypothetical protein
MPKKRKKSGTKKLEKRLQIVCEGKKDKSESAYFKALIEDCSFAGERVEVSVVDTNKNTGKELVEEAKKIREFDFDEVWVVYDKDRYTMHADTFSRAKNSNIKIAFSAISFETWILLHFEYTTKNFLKSEDIIHHMKAKKYLDYQKSSESVYDDTKSRLTTAISNAQKIQKYQENSNPTNTKIYEFGAYTDIDKLITAIFLLQSNK